MLLGYAGRCCHRALVASLVGCVAPTAVAYAQASVVVTVRGVVVRGDRTPIRNAIVTLIGRKDSALTTATGSFLFQGVRAGRDSLRVRAVGFEPRVEPINVSADSGWGGHIILGRLTQQLPQVTVNAPQAAAGMWKYEDFFRRQRSGFGTFRTREDFEKMGASDIISALRSIPGVNVSATGNPNGETEVRWRIARCPGQPPNIAIYVNGTAIAGSGAGSNKGSELSGFFRSGGSRSTCEGCARMGDLFNSLPLMDIMFVEFYRGPAQIPAELDLGDACAALVIWTR